METTQGVLFKTLKNGWCSIRSNTDLIEYTNTCSNLANFGYILL
jgi:hypothetical protein